MYRDWRELNYARFFQRRVGAVFVDRLQAPRSHANPDKLLQFRHPNPLLPQIRRENTRHIFCHVPPDSAFFLRHTTTVNDAAARDPGTRDGANF